KKTTQNLCMTADIIKFKDPKQKNKNLNSIRKNLGFALTGNYSEKIEDWEIYESFLKEIEEKTKGTNK
ncbi:MAG: hypothetical protein U9N62_03310, partial [Thermotogota bacterium]|nr:hypothetical protein [Thermotogota bacterium]